MVPRNSEQFMTSCNCKIVITFHVFSYIKYFFHDFVDFKTGNAIKI